MEVYLFTSIYILSNKHLPLALCKTLFREPIKKDAREAEDMNHNVLKEVVESGGDGTHTRTHRHTRMCMHACTHTAPHPSRTLSAQQKCGGVRCTTAAAS